MPDVSPDLLSHRLPYRKIAKEKRGDRRANAEAMENTFDLKQT